ncbi:hypothetical protein SAY87_020973 [Trapa incisa]|uniref:Uncharacterized protein n=1 Tax=Trapa incisa TaxID=236973 RepID=A0AAN7JQK4_9MYRT|nr:hypothetical protein SAY87_020973 [Trapa incisa]
MWYYGLDPLSNKWQRLPLMPAVSLDDEGSAKMKLYDDQDDARKVVAEDVPVHGFTDSECPYLLAGLLGKLHVITKDSRSNITVMQADVRQNIAPFPATLCSSRSSSSSFFPVKSICFSGGIRDRPLEGDSYQERGLY